MSKVVEVLLRRAEHTQGRSWRLGGLLWGAHDLCRQPGQPSISVLQNYGAVLLLQVNKLQGHLWTGGTG